MKQLISTTDVVRLSFLLALLRDAGFPARVFDAHISALEAGIGAFPCRIMVPPERILAAKFLLEDAEELYND